MAGTDHIERDDWEGAEQPEETTAAENTTPEPRTPEPPVVQITIRQRDNNTIRVAVAGNVSRGNWLPEDDPIQKQCGSDVFQSNVLMDLHDTEYIDSTGVEWLLQCHSRCENQGGRLVLHSATPITDQLLRMMRMDAVLHMARNEAEAVEQITSARQSDAEGSIGIDSTTEEPPRDTAETA
ncbi:MAG: STAS domain-containing protein [Planctomycetota bacterium]